MKPSITLTGVDERTNIAELHKLDAEIGFLYTGTPEGRNRYPSWDWIRQASLNVRRASLHVCGRLARQFLLAGHLPVGSFQRIQVNGRCTWLEVEQLCRMYPHHTVITQFSYKYEDQAALLAVDVPNHALLVDASGGRGLLPAEWVRPITDKQVGFAGGLGPHNLLEELPRIKAAAGDAFWWVDMEQSLRDPDDWFSIARAQRCIQAFQARTGDTKTQTVVHLTPSMGKSTELHRRIFSGIVVGGLSQMSHAALGADVQAGGVIVAHLTVPEGTDAALVEKVRNLLALEGVQVTERGLADGTTLPFSCLDATRHMQAEKEAAKHYDELHTTAQQRANPNPHPFSKFMKRKGKRGK